MLIKLFCLGFQEPSNEKDLHLLGGSWRNTAAPRARPKPLELLPKKDVQVPNGLVETATSSSEESRASGDSSSEDSVSRNINGLIN